MRFSELSFIVVVKGGFRKTKSSLKNSPLLLMLEEIKIFPFSFKTFPTSDSNFGGLFKAK
jgi:hypothetical protein